MKAICILSVLGIVVLAGALSAQEGPSKGTLKKVDADKGVVTITVADKDQDFFLAPSTTVMDGATRKKVDNPLQSKLLTAGIPVLFKAAERDGKKVLVGLMLNPGKQPAGKERPPFKKVDSSKLVPLDELGNKEYQQGYKGGFYPDGKNERPAAHEAAGLRIAKTVEPFNTDGKPDPQGRIVMLSVGMSNTGQASTGFMKVLAREKDINPRFKFINGAVGGQTAKITESTETPQGMKYWAIVDERLKDAGSSREQVQIIWIKQADGGPNQGFPGYAKKLEDELANLVRIFPKRFPNAKLVYLTSRTYGGYASTPLNPEPYAYEGGFSVKWLIERQLKGEPALNYDKAKDEVKAPWLSWGPYFWANGSTKRAADGFYYEESDFTSNDGTHLSPSGMDKVGRLMLQFFKTDSTSRPWFVAAQ
jgi:hypothetical protein